MAENTRKLQSLIGYTEFFTWIKEYVGLGSKHEAVSRHRVFRVDPDLGGDDAWGGRLLALCDGRPPSEIIRILYQEELANGAGLTDIGIWKSLFDRSVLRDISSLCQKGYLRVQNYRETDPGVAVKCNDRIPATDAAQPDGLLISIEG